MSGKEKEKFLTEVDKMILKLDDIIISIKGKEGAINYKSVKDGFDRLRFEINDKLKEVETLFIQRDKIMTSTIPKEIYERKTIENKLEELLDEIDTKLKKLEIELKAQKSKVGKYGDFTQKEKMVKLMEDKYGLFRSKLDGMEIDDKAIEENKSSIEQLEDIIAREEGKAPQQERELYEEEKAKMEEWKEEVRRQDEDLEDIHNVVKQIKEEARMASENIERTNKNVEKLTKSTEKVTKRVNTQNKKLKDLISKLRAGDKLCMDIILILIALGLVAVLYYLIKARFF
jgi:methyl-accepting chemotaxis protein